MRRPLLFWSFCLVVLIALIYSRGPDTMVSGPPDGSRIRVTGRVCDKDETSFELKILNLEILDDLNDAAYLQTNIPSNELYDVNKYDKLLVSWDRATELILGSEVTLVGDFYAFSRATNPGEFDYGGYYYSMGYLGRVRGVVIVDAIGAAGLREQLWRLRRFWENRLYQVFPEREASVMAAILLGEKKDVDAELKALYTRNGIVHILSISGLHITIIGLGFYNLLRRIGLPVWAAALCGGTVLVLYGIMTGFGVSVCRAMGMYLLRMLALLIGRTYDMLTALGFVGVVMAVVQPAWLGHMGYLLSFGSVMGLGLLLPALTWGREEDGPGKPLQYVEGIWKQRLVKLWRFVSGLLREGMLAGLSITLTTLPIQLWFSYEISIYSVFLNALILPLMSLVMVTGLVAMIVPGLGFVGTVDVLILTGYEGLCYVFEALPAAMWNPGRPVVWQVVLYCLIWAVVVWVLPWVRKEFREQYQEKSRRMSLAIRLCQVILLVVAVGVLALPKFHGDRVTFLDVGQGDCICVQLSSGEVYLFDCGSSSRRGVGEEVLIPFLKYYGINQVDAVFASHGDTDHINGLAELLALGQENHIKVEKVVLPDIDRAVLNEEFGELLAAAEGAGVPVRVISAGERWDCGEDLFMCVHPQTSADSSGKSTITTASKRYSSSGGNADSECFYIVLREGKQGLRILLTGDVEKEGEFSLVRYLEAYGLLEAEVLKVAHHGSKYSTSEVFLENFHPQLSVISCGRRNSYGHPHEETLERLETAGSEVISTPQCGAVTIEVGKTVKVYGFK